MGCRLDHAASISHTAGPALNLGSERLSPSTYSEQATPAHLGLSQKKSFMALPTALPCTAYSAGAGSCFPTGHASHRVTKLHPVALVQRLGSLPESLSATQHRPDVSNKCIDHSNSRTFRKSASKKAKPPPLNPPQVVVLCSLLLSLLVPPVSIDCTICFRLIFQPSAWVRGAN